MPNAIEIIELAKRCSIFTRFIVVLRTYNCRLLEKYEGVTGADVADGDVCFGSRALAMTQHEGPVRIREPVSVCKR
jgi:hypothetical protein